MSAKYIMNLSQCSSDRYSYFNDFKGTAVCKIMAADLYTPPVKTDEGYSYCNSRAALLEALSGGGRHGFDTPYVSRSKSAQHTCMEPHP